MNKQKEEKEGRETAFGLFGSLFGHFYDFSCFFLLGCAFVDVVRRCGSIFVAFLLPKSGSEVQIWPKMVPGGVPGEFPGELGGAERQVLKPRGHQFKIILIPSTPFEPKSCQRRSPGAPRGVVLAPFLMSFSLLFSGCFSVAFFIDFWRHYGSILAPF